MTADFSSAIYWEGRYAEGRNSGSGSYGRLSEFKAQFLNDFVREQGVTSVIEFGSGDGNQVSLANYPKYIGVDVSRTAIGACRERFSGDSTKTFVALDEYAGETAELSMSLDVIYHLVEDEVFDAYMTKLFDAAQRYVIVYASNYDGQPRRQHVRHRYFMDWILRNRPEFALVKFQKNPYPSGMDGQTAESTSPADFFIFEKVSDKTGVGQPDVMTRLRGLAREMYNSPAGTIRRLASTTPQVDLVTVVFNDELPLLATQARSIAKFFPKRMIGSIIFMINEFDPTMCRNYIEKRIIPELGPIGERVIISDLSVFASARDLTGEDVEGWLSQQACKLVASRLCSSDYFLVLDAKHHFIRPVKPENIFYKGRARKPLGKVIKDQKPWLLDSLLYFGVNPALADQPSPASAPPFSMHTATVRRMTEEIERREGGDLLSFFARKTDFTTEFTLYFAYLLKNGIAGDHLVDGPSSHRDFRITTRGQRRANLEQSLSKTNEIWCFSVHRRRLAKLPREDRALVVSTWRKSGLFPTKERAITAIIELEGHFKHLRGVEEERIAMRDARRAKLAVVAEGRNGALEETQADKPVASEPLRKDPKSKPVICESPKPAALAAETRESVALTEVRQHFDLVTQLFSGVKYMNEGRALVMRDLIQKNDAQEILEIGFYQGKSSAYIAAILEDLGRGSLVTIDRRDPEGGKVNLAGLLLKTGLSHRVKAIQAQRSFTWELQKMITDGGGPRFDFCYFDGGHTWDDTGFGFTLVNLLLRPGGVIVFDDIDWTIEGSAAVARHPERAATFSEDERTTPTVRRVWETLVPAFGYTDLREIPKVGWALARKPRQEAD